MMKTILKVLVLAGSVAIMSGCSTLPLGVSKAEWAGMSLERQAEYRQLQKIADIQKRQEAASDQRYIEQSIKQAETPSGRPRTDQL